MLPKKTISTFVSALNSRIPPPVHTAGIENSRPIPAVIIENMMIEEQNYHNSNFAGSEYDSDGNVTKEIYRHYYDLRLELVVRDDDEPQAFNILGQLQQALSEIGRDPRNTLHEDIHAIDTRGSGGVSYQFYEPTETEINQSVVIKTFYDSESSDLDTLQNLGSNYNIS